MPLIPPFSKIISEILQVMFQLGFEGQTNLQDMSKYIFQLYHLAAVSLHIGLFFKNITPRCFSPTWGGPNTCLHSGFALTVLPPSSVTGISASKSWHPFRHVLLLSCILPLILITSCIKAPAYLDWCSSGWSSSVHCCYLRAELSRWDKDLVIDAFPRVVDCSAGLPHVLIMTHDGILCHWTMMGNEDG